MTYVYRQPPHVQFRQRVFPFLLLGAIAGSITEGATAGDTFAAVVVAVGSHTEGAQAGDTFAAAQISTPLFLKPQLAPLWDLYENRLSVPLIDGEKTFVYPKGAIAGAFSDGALAGDTQTGALVAVGSHTEGAQAGDTFAASTISTPLFLKPQLAPRWQLYDESLDVSVLDQKTAVFPEGAIKTGAITEGAKAGDTESGVLNPAIGSITEGAKAGDTQAGSLTAVGSHTEGAKAGDTFAGSIPSLYAPRRQHQIAPLWSSYREPTIVQLPYGFAVPATTKIGNISEGAAAGDSFAAVQISTPLFLKPQLAPLWPLYENRLDVPVLDRRLAIFPDLIKTGAISEGAIAGDTETGLLVAVGSHTEGAKAGDSFAGQQISTPLFLKPQLAPLWDQYIDRLAVPLIDGEKTFVYPKDFVAGTLTEGAKAGDSFAGILGPAIASHTEGAKAGDTFAASQISAGIFVRYYYDELLARIT